MIDPQIVAVAYREVCRLPELPEPRQLVMREANMHDLQQALINDELDLVVIPSVGPRTGFEHRVIGSEAVVLVEPDNAEEPEQSVQLDQISGRQLILMPDTCGLTAFTNDLVTTHNLSLTTDPGEASTYRVGGMAQPGARVRADAPVQGQRRRHPLPAGDGRRRPGRDLRPSPPSWFSSTRPVPTTPNA